MTPVNVTPEENYLKQLSKSADSLKLPIPEHISQAIVEKITALQGSSKFLLPESILYTQFMDTTKFPTSSHSHLSKVKLGGWQLEILKVVTATEDKEILLAFVTRVGSTCKKPVAVDHRNGNTPARSKAIRR